MQYFTERGYSHREVLEKVRARYGDAAKILNHRAIKIGGFIGLFARDGVELTFILADDAIKEDVKKQKDIEEEKRRLLDRINQEKSIQEVLEEVRSIKSIVEVGVGSKQVNEIEHSTIKAIDELLEINDFSHEFREGIKNNIRQEFSLEELENYHLVEDAVLCWIGDGISIAEHKKNLSPRIIVLVGPTGVGKTTTIAKLAAIHNLGLYGESSGKVRMITIDNFRIGALHQIETYGSIMEVPVSVAETAGDLKTIIGKNRDLDLILVDTIGKSPRDAIKLAEMQEILDAAGGQAEVYLAVSATTKTRDMLDIFRQFEPFDYQSLIITKMDETSRIGNILSALKEKSKKVSWITTGQRVPNDIEKAHQINFLMKLEGFNRNRPKLEERYGNVALRQQH